ncbi:MAG TPA: choice-of-anchor B family protein [Acidobacteriota bacterium]|nr:choice-of-anchor B family protein [Acidobacteriota bacterium]
MKNLLRGLSVLTVLVAFAAPAYAQVGFGRVVAIADDEVFVGEAGNKASSGYVYVYRRDGSDWTEVAELTASDATNGDGFGTAISVDGELLLVSAVTAESGAVYMFHRDGRSWNEVGALMPSEGLDSDRFGASLSRDGTRLIVGAPGADDGWGAAFVFEMQNHQWVQVAHLSGMSAPTEHGGEGEPAAVHGGADGEHADSDAGGDDADPPTPERFGAAVLISGEWAVVGAPNASRRAGLAYVFHDGDDGWEQVTTLGDFSEENDRFGSSFALRESELLVGAIGAGQLGSVRRFRFDGESGELTRAASMFPFEGTAFGFGAALAVQGDDIYVAAPRANNGAGVIFRYTDDGAGNWSDVSKIGTGEFGPRSQFAASLAVDGDIIVAGVPRVDFGAGQAMILTRTYGGWDRTTVLSDIKALERITGSAVPCDAGQVGHFECAGVDLLAFLPTHEIGGERGVVTNDIWGWTDPDTNRDFAIVGLSNAASFVDVTDPYNPVYVGKLPRTDGSNSSVWRDIKVYADHAFIVSDSAGEHGMQVFDLKRLREFEGDPITFLEDVLYTDMNSAHNIVINEETAFAFIVGASGGGETCGGGLHMVNIEDPKQPVFAGCFQDVRTGQRGTGYSHDAQCVTYHGPDERYAGREICFGSNETALSIADVSDKRDPQAIGMSSYPNVAYSHQGWLTEDHRYFYMNDEGDEMSGLVEGTRTIVWDVQDLEDPIVANEFVSENPAIDHNLYVVGNVMYQSNYDSGLRVFDVSEPEEIKEIGFIDTVPFGEDGQGMGGSWSNYPYFSNGIVVITSMSEGFFVAKLRDDALPAGATSGSERE